MTMADKSETDEVVSAAIGPSSIQDRIAAFGMIDRMVDATQAQKCLRLSLVGFGRHEIAAMLQTTPAIVSQNLYAERAKLKKKSAAKKQNIDAPSV